MNILFLNNYVPIFGGADSGASNRSTMFISALAELGHVDVDDNPRDVALVVAKTAQTLRNRLYHRIYANTLDCMVK